MNESWRATVRVVDVVVVEETSGDDGDGIDTGRGRCVTRGEGVGVVPARGVGAVSSSGAAITGWSTWTAC